MKSDRDESICALVAHSGLSYKAIGAQFGITRQRVQQIAERGGVIQPGRYAKRKSKPVSVEACPGERGSLSKTDLNIKSLRLQLDYNRHTGAWTWLNGPCAGRVAGSLNSEGYVQIRVDGKLYMAHVLAWLYSFGQWPTSLIDHDNRTRWDNRLNNLRLATYSQNFGNTTKRKHNTSGFKGVTKHGNKWRAEIAHVKLGTFDTKEEAADAYAQAAKLRYGIFAAGT